MYEEKLDLLRKAGVIDMELSFGCVLGTGYGVTEKIIQTASLSKCHCGHWEYVTTRGNIIETTGKNIERLKGLSKENYKILGHDLLYGRVCRWINEHSRKKTRVDIGPYSALIEECKFSDLWHRKDLPLSQQQNKEEIVNFIISLLPEGH